MKELKRIELKTSQCIGQLFNNMDIYIERQAGAEIKNMQYSKNPFDLPLTMSYYTNEDNVSAFFIPDTVYNQLKVAEIINNNSNLSCIIVIVNNANYQIYGYDNRYILKSNVLFNKVLTLIRKSINGENFSVDLLDCMS